MKAGRKRSSARRARRERIRQRLREQQLDVIAGETGLRYVVRDEPDRALGIGDLRARHLKPWEMVFKRARVRWATT